MGSASLNVRMSWRYQYFAVLGKLTYVDSGTCSSSPKEYTPDSPTEVCCAFRGWPLPRIIWRKNKSDAKLIVNDSDGFSLSEMLEGNGTLRSFLRISKSKEKHERDYECIAENSIPGWPSPQPVIFELSLQCEWGLEGAGHSLWWPWVFPSDMGTFFRLKAFQTVQNLELKYIKGFTENLPFKYFPKRSFNK